MVGPPCPEERGVVKCAVNPTQSGEFDMGNTQAERAAFSTAIARRFIPLPLAFWLRQFCAPLCDVENNR
jgi:hypothetical protein